MSRGKRIAKALLMIAIAMSFLTLYLHVTGIQNDKNDDLKMSDQRGYMRFAQKARQSNWHHTGGRNRMPLFPFFQALFYSPELTNEAFFLRGKQINIWLSVAAIASFAIAFSARFSRMYAIYAVLVIAFLAFAFKAPFFQAEILYYTLFGFAFILSIDALFAPKWHKSIGVGALLALAHLCKASATPALILFASCYGVLLIANFIRRDLEWHLARDIVLRALTPALVFILLLFPYLQESKEIYGRYFYNVNTMFYVWYDTWEEAKAGTRAAGDRAGYPDLPEE